MNTLNRRQFIATTAVTSLSAGALLSAVAQAKRRQMTMDLVCGNLGVSAGQREAIEPGGPPWVRIRRGQRGLLGFAFG